MKNLTTSVLKVLKISFVMIALASPPLMAGGNDNKTELNKRDDNAYLNAIAELEDAMNEAKSLEKTFMPMSQIKIYDTNFNLVGEATISDDGIVEDKEVLKLLLQSSVLVKYEYMTFYILYK